MEAEGGNEAGEKKVDDNDSERSGKLAIKNVWKNMTPCKVYFSQNSKPDYEKYADCRNDFDIKLDSFLKKKLHETSRGLASLPFPPPCKSRGSAVNRT